VFRPEDIVPSTFIANIAIDMGSSCEDTFAYFSDELGYGLIAYSWEQNRSWRFSHSYFMPDPLVGDFNIAGLNFQWYAEGIFGITLSPIGPDGYRTLFFSPLSSHTEFAVSTKILRDESKVEESFQDFKVVGVRGADGHTTSKVMDDRGVELFNLIDQNAIGCWNSALPLKPQNTAVVDKDDVGLVFPSDVKIDAGRNVWVMSDRMPVFLEAELDYSDINFRIYTARLDSLLEGTVCEPERKFIAVPKRQKLKPTTVTLPYATRLPSVTLPPLTKNVYAPAMIPQSQLALSYPKVAQTVYPKASSYVNIDFPKTPTVPIVRTQPIPITEKIWESNYA
jgi:hypothetical protein